MTFGASYLLLGPKYSDLWWVLSIIISCGTIAGALIPEFTKIFTSTKSKHVKEVVTSANQGGASLGILSGFVAGNFSAFWEGTLILGLMFVAYLLSGNDALVTVMPKQYTFAASIFAFGLVAFGFLGMGPVTIAVDCFGPVTDNAQSVYELSQIEAQPDIKADIKKNFGFEPDFENAKHFLESNDGAGNTFKATAKPVLIGTAVVGATTMIFGIILLLDHNLAGLVAGAQSNVGEVVKYLSLVQPQIAFGLLMGGATIYWFTGASMPGRRHRLVPGGRLHQGTHGPDERTRPTSRTPRKSSRSAPSTPRRAWSTSSSSSSASPWRLAFFNPFFFIGYLIAIAFFGLFQAIFMANAGGAWDNAKKIVEVDLKMKGTDLHAATVVGDTVGDPFKDTSRWP